MSRYRLIPCSGLHGSRFVYGEASHALTVAQAMAAERGTPVLIVEHNPGERVQAVAEVGRVRKGRMR